MGELAARKQNAYSPEALGPAPPPKPTIDAPGGDLKFPRLGPTYRLVFREGKSGW